MEKETDIKQEQFDSGQGNQENLQFLAALREKFKIQVTRKNFISFLDYTSSLELDSDVFDIDKKKKLALEDYVHFFELERKTEEVESSKINWSIRRRSPDFFKLEKKLNEELVGGAKMSKSEIPQLSLIYDKREQGSPEKFAEAAEIYLKKLLESPEIRARSKVLYEFLEISLLPLPIAPEKYKEGYLKKKGGGRFKRNKVKLYFSYLFAKCQERWFILTEDGILYTVDSSSTKTREILFFDQSFQVEYGKKATGHSNGVSIVTPNRRLNLLAEDAFEAADWVSDIQKAAKASPYTTTHRFNSFAPEREFVHNCKWYIDAVGYFEDLYETLSQAKKEVFITDWWFSPEISLKRPVQDGESEYRLDKVLGKIANAGVKVYVIVYHEVRMLMYNDSEYVKTALESLSPNITVLKHPSEPFFSWSHHEKMVVVDQTIGYIGGLDLCFGRWDTSDHPLHDPALEAGKGVTYYGQDYANPRLVDFRNVREQPHITLIDKNEIPRMPFHDAMIRVTGPVVADMSRHFIQFWNHVEVDCYDKEEEAPLPKHGLIPAVDETSFSKEKVLNNLRDTFRNVVGFRDFAQKAFGTHKNDPKKNTSELRSQTFSKVNEKEKNVVEDKSKIDASEIGDREEEKEQNSASLIKDKKEAEEPKNTNAKLDNDDQNESVLKESNESENTPGGLQKVLYQVKNKFLSLVNHIRRQDTMSDDKEEKKEGSEEKGLNTSQVNEEEHGLRQLLKSHKNKHAEHKEEKMKLKKEAIEKARKRDILQLLFMPEKEPLKGTLACQMLRSASKWSMGLNTKEENMENSILNAYLQAIQEAKHFIYIESQFFMSGTAGKALKNEVGECLLFRIERAHARQERFRILVFIPLIHAFEGDIVDTKSSLLRLQLHWQYMTISRGGGSIYEGLKKKGIPAEDYIQFYSVRQHHKMANGVPATEMIYIHSKILIADDDILIIGSANINDRSLEGSRDSEIAMHFEDSKKVVSHMNGVEVKVSEFVHTFRKRILAEHVGLSETEVADPLTDKFIKTMNSRALRNTEIYREVFACYPDDNMKTLKGISEYSENRKLEKYDELASQIKGHVVMYPLDFLCDEELLPAKTAMEHYLADQNFV